MMVLVVLLGGGFRGDNNWDMFTRTFRVVSPDSNFELNVWFFPAEEQHMDQCLDFPDAHLNSGNMDDYMGCMVC